MRTNHKRFFMAEVDSGSGNGAAVPSATDTVAAPQAEGAAPSLTLDSIISALDKRLDERDQKLHDRVFATLRRDGSLPKKEKPTPAQADAAQQTAPDPMRLRALDRALSKQGLADKLSDSQYKRVERLFAEEAPDDAVSWVKDYFDGFGVAQSPQPVTAQAAPAKPVAEHPVSNRGAPPPAQVPLEELDLYTASDADRAAFLKAKGPKAYTDLLRKQGKGRPVRFG